MAEASHNPRFVAYDVLRAVDEQGAFADRALDGRLRRSRRMRDEDRRLATELVYGVLRRRGSLDAGLRACVNRPLERLDPAVLRILRLGAYQVLFLDRVPDHAAVNESVTLARRRASRGAAGLVNAVLRALCRVRDAEGEAPLGAGEERPEVDFPDWLVELWNAQLGRDRAGRLFRALLAPPPVWLRVNTLKTDRETLREALAREGYEAEPDAALPLGLLLRSGGDLRKATASRRGWCVQQDGASQLVAGLLDPAPGERILDLCAAPGIKTTQLCAAMKDEGLVVAADLNLGRLRELAALCRRLGARIARPLCADGGLPDRTALAEAAFDRVLLDAPCSGLGVLRRNPERKWRPAPDFASLAALQGRLLRTAARLVRPGGILLYGTCTLNRAENEDVVQGFLSETEGYMLEDVRPFLPEGLEDLAGRDGCFRSWARPERFDFFFAARLRRREGG